jgi:aspartate 1-decarboxylase
MRELYWTQCGQAGEQFPSSKKEMLYMKRIIQTRDILNQLPPSAMIRACMAKLHRVKVTHAKLDYVGSITIDQNLIDAVGMQPGQYVNITNVSNGILWQTYIMPAKRRGSGEICLNGPPARHFQPGDLIIVLAEIWLKPTELADLTLRVALVDENNKLEKVEKYFG